MKKVPTIALPTRFGIWTFFGERVRNNDESHGVDDNERPSEVEENVLGVGGFGDVQFYYPDSFAIVTVLRFCLFPSLDPHRSVYKYAS